MAHDPWNPEQYARFAHERQQPFWDLLALVRPRSGMRIVDLGCGTGELTRELHTRLAARETLGIDSSEAMLAKSAAFAGDGLSFERGDAGELAAGPWDLVFSNAALHWVPDHPGLLDRLTALLTDGGQLAVQVPANYDHASHLVAAAVAREAPFGAALGGHVRDPKPVLAPEDYAVLLARLGYRQQHVRLHVYGHWLAARDDVIEWVKGTLLTAYERRLPTELYDRFLERYRERLLPLLDDTRPYFFPFKRVLVWASR